MPSPKHRLLEWWLPLRSSDLRVTDPNQQAALRLVRQERTRLAPPRRVVRTLDVEEDGTGFPVFHLRPRGQRPPRSVLFLHGGGYVGHADLPHWRFAAWLVRRLGVRVVLPQYRLAPVHTWRDSRPDLTALLSSLEAESPGGVVLLGDSAGGGLALALAQHAVATGSARPTHLALVSPWADLTNQSLVPTGDPWLSASYLDVCAPWWAGPDPLWHPEVSPLFGSFAGLPPMLVQCGTRDVLLQQSRDVVAAARSAGVEVSYVEEPGLLHDYPLLRIPEAARARRELVAFLRPDERKS